MTDQHTHILPGMDDGSRSAEMSLELLRAEAAQGVDTVILTPHYDRMRESSVRFLERRALALERLREAMLGLPEEEREGLPSLLLGAEVAWTPDLIDCRHLEDLCVTGTRAFLLELPMAPWRSSMLVQIQDLMTATGLTPVIAHIDRYWGSQKPALISELFALRLPVQLSADTLLHFSSRGKALKALRSGQVRYLMSDCHDPRYRRPNLGEALTVVGKKLGEAVRRQLAKETDDLVRRYASAEA